MNSKNQTKLLLLGAVFCLLLSSLVIFNDFVFGNKVLLYKDIGSDSLTDYYPWFVHLSDYIRSNGIPAWSFSVAMGQDIFYQTGYLILQPIVWLPKQFIAQALIFQHLLKIVLVGLLFYRFLQLRGLQVPARFLGSFLLSFSAYMCMGSCWFPIADEVVCFTALLCAAQEWLKRGRWFLLPLAVALAGLLGPFHLYLSALLLLFYVPAKLFVRYGWRPRLILGFCLVVGAAAVLGVGLEAIISVPYVYTILNSPRGTSATSWVATLSSFPTFAFESQLHYITAMLRPMGNDLLGTGDSFGGWQNYFEAPMTYCGLLAVLLSPQTFVAASHRQRIVYVFFLAGVLLPTIFPWFRYLFWLFQGDYYRAHSLFSILGLITLAAIAFSRYAQGRSLNIWLLAGTLFLLLTILYLPITECQKRIDPELKLRAALFLVAYGVLLVIGKVIKRQGSVAWIVMALVAVELILFDRITVGQRSTVTKQELTERVGYDDGTLAAVRDFGTSDKSFFRTSKPRFSAPTTAASLNDAMVFGYYGTSCYSSFNNINYINFLSAIGAMQVNSEYDTRWSVGLLDSAIWSTFATEKYVLSDDPIYYQDTLQYEVVKSYGRDYLLRNLLNLPFGLSFNRYMPEDAFQQLSVDEKPQAALRAVILAKGEESQGLQWLSIEELRQEIRAIPPRALVTGLRSGAFELTSFHQSRIEGRLRDQQKRVLVFQTPFDRGWRAFEDGRPTRVLKVDIGLLGVVVDPGEHRLALRYSTPFLGCAATISVVSLLALLLCLWRWPRMPLPA